MSEHLDHEELRTDFRLDVESVDGVSVVAVAGDVDLYSAPDLRDQLTSLAERRTGRVVVDLSEVTFLDSMGLGVLVGAAKRALERDTHVDLVVPTTEIRRIFEITMLDEIFDVYESRPDALARQSAASTDG